MNRINDDTCLFQTFKASALPDIMAKLSELNVTVLTSEWWPCDSITLRLRGCDPFAAIFNE